MKILRNLFVVISITSLLSCKNMVNTFDQHIHKTYLRKGFVSENIQDSLRQIHYYDNKRENAPVLLFIHGFGGDGKITWKDQAKAFEKDYRVIIPDILWFGDSKSDEAPELQTQIDAVNELIEQLSLDNIHLVGISYGGFISLGVAKQNQKKLATLTIVDSPGVHFTDEELKAFCEKVGVENVADAFLPTNSDEVKRMMDFAFSKPPKLTSNLREQTIGIYFSKNPVEQRKMLEDLPKNRTQFRELNITIPVLVLWGAEDEIFLTSDARQLQTQLDAELVIIPKAGHSLPFEQAKDFNQALRKFIESAKN